MDAKLLGYDVFTGGVSSKAIGEAVSSQLPGRHNGPADAYRHLLLSAELTRRYGEWYARKILDAHEWTGNNDGQKPDEEAMDRHNNDIGIEIGKTLSQNPSSSWDDVVKEARKKINPDDSNYKEGAMWLDRWDTNPKDEQTGKEIPNEDSRLNWPPEWPSGPYSAENSSAEPSGLIPLMLLGMSISELWHNEGLDKIIQDISNKYYIDLDKSATYRIIYIEPLTLDLDGDGIEAVAETGRSGVMFDTDTDGVSTATGWISADDGLLVRDINKNGIIDNGSEFFGDNTQLLNGSKAADGFSALADLDDNHDGKVDSNDAAFSELKIWRDLNQDGISSADELFSLSDLNQGERMSV